MKEEKHGYATACHYLKKRKNSKREAGEVEWCWKEHGHRGEVQGCRRGSPPIASVQDEALLQRGADRLRKRSKRFLCRRGEQRKMAAACRIGATASAKRGGHIRHHQQAGGGHRDQAKQPTRMETSEPSLRAPRLQEAAVIQEGTWYAEVPQVLPVGQVPQVPAPRVLLEEEAQQEAVQPPAAGELAQLSALSGLVGSLSSVVKSLSNVSVHTVSPATVSAPVKPSAAVLNIQPANLSSQHSPVVNFNVGIQRDVLGPGPLHTAASVRVNVPESCMKDVMPCEMSPLSHLSLYG